MTTHYTHTPGPWWFTENHGGQVEIGAGDEVLATVGRKTYSLGFSAGGDDRANARLIVAAPETTSALAEFVRLTSPEYAQECREGHHPYPDVDLSIARDRAIKALKKAGVL